LKKNRKNFLKKCVFSQKMGFSSLFLHISH